jgi:mono/diheme cytochrome c family protein
MYAYLQALPPTRNEFRRSYGFVGGPPVPPPSYTSTTAVERGLEIPRLFSSGPAAERDRVGRGSYLVNALSDCSNCHTDGAGDDGGFDGGTLPMSLDINTETYLAGGVNFAPFVGIFATPIFTRNLTPHGDNGLQLTEDEFIQALRFGADFSRPGGSLRIEPHFPAEFRMTLEDIKSIYAFLRIVPAIDKTVEIFELGG